MDSFLATYGEASKTALGFFWKAGWAFVLGYSISAMIQTFVPKKRLTRHMGDFSLRSTGIATGFGAISSSCSFAALAFMFASTNLVIELGILIYIFLGRQYVLDEIIGGLVLIAMSSLLIRLFYPTN